MQSTRIPVLNSLVFIRDEFHSDLPDIDGVAAIWFSNKAVAVSCLPDTDGETRIILSASESPPDELVEIFDGVIDTPSRSIIVGTMPNVTLFRMPSGPTTRIQVWTDGFQDSEIVFIRIVT